MQRLTELDLAAKIRQLQADRQRHAEAIAAIDSVLGRVGDALAASKGLTELSDPTLVEPPGGRGTPGKRRRGKFAQTADQSVLDFIRQKREPSTADINAHWRAEGRLGTSNVTLLKLLKSGQVRRVEDPGIRGSRYVLAENTAAQPAAKTRSSR
jgi:hypothetical protein